MIVHGLTDFSISFKPPPWYNAFSRFKQWYRTITFPSDFGTRLELGWDPTALLNHITNRVHLLGCVNIFNRWTARWFDRLIPGI